jgi:pimeloyl-ACP methyl ester carboxylesterase
MLTSRHASDVRIRRGFASHGQGCAHFRWAGDGAALVALHESPRSSLSLLPLIDGLAGRRTVVAVDTPGYGHSDPLAWVAPSGDDYAGAFTCVLDSLGLARAPVYGTHTGAALAVHLALARPERVSALLLDGFGAFTAEERDDFLGRYLAPFEPAWDGSHLAHLWSRCKDLFVWFPWHVREPATRLAFDPPPVARVHDTVLGFLMAGPGYSKGYRCAAVLDAQPALAALAVPTTVTARPHDLIHSHLDRVAPTPSVRVARIDASVEAWLRGVDGALPGTARVAHLAARRRAPHRDGWERVLVELGDGYLHALDRGTGEEADVVLGDLPDAAVRLAATLRRPARRTLVLDPPGTGASDPLRGGSDVLESTVDALRGALDSLGVRSYRLAGVGLGGILAAALAARDPRVTFAVAIELPAWARGEGGVPDELVVPAPVRDADGASLFTTWYRLRDRWLYDDAGSPAPVQRRRSSRLPDARELHARHAALWIGPESARLAAALQDAVRRRPALCATLRRVDDVADCLAALHAAPP